MATKPIKARTFKGVKYSVYQESPNVYCIKVSNIFGPGKPIVFYMSRDDKIDKIARRVINQTKKYAKDGVLSKTELVKIDRFINDLLKQEDADVRTLTPITNQNDIRIGSVIIPREVDIVALEDVLIIKKLYNDNGKPSALCIQHNEPVKPNEDNLTVTSLTIEEIIGGYLIVEYITEDVKEYIGYKKQVEVYEKYFTKKIKEISTDINESSTWYEDNNIADFITNTILESKYNGLLKERMISFIEEKLK